MKFYIQTDGNDKVIRMTNVEEDGFTEVEIKDANLIGQPLVYRNGKLMIDDAEIKHLEDSVKIDNLKQKLADTDYVVFKIAEGVATEKEYADILKQRAEWRDRISELEKGIG